MPILNFDEIFSSTFLFSELVRKCVAKKTIFRRTTINITYNKVTRLVQSPLVVAGSDIAATTSLRVSAVRVYITILRRTEQNWNCSFIYYNLMTTYNTEMPKRCSVKELKTLYSDSPHKKINICLCCLINVVILGHTKQSARHLTLRSASTK